jgi:hypothetical protein
VLVALVGLVGLVALVGLGMPQATAQGQQTIPVSSILPQKRPAPHPLDPAIEMAQNSLRYIQENLQDYTALFVKRCRVNGQLPAMQYANIKIRNRKTQEGRITTPMAVYLDFLKPSSVKGREVIWVEGQNDGNLVVHDSGYRGMVNLYLDPNGYIAMRNQRYPITEIGIENLVVKLIESALRDRQHNECEVNFFKNAKIGETVCTMLEVIHPIQRAHFDFYRARVYFAEDLRMPIRYESYSWPVTPDGKPVLEEEYNYLNVKTNVGLTDYDFDTSNPDYRFR